MSRIIVPSRRVWTRQPQVGALIDWANPVNKDLVFAFEASFGQRDLITGAGEGITAGVTNAVGKFGKQYNYSGSQTNRSCSFGLHKGMMGATSATWDILVYFNSANPSAHFFGQWDFSLRWLLQASSGGLVWVAAQNDAGGRARFDASGVIFPNSGWYRLICSWRGNGVGDQTIMVNGAVKDNGRIGTSATVIGPTNTLDYLQIGGINGGTPLNGAVAFARAWRRGMSVAEMQALSANPWQIFQPREQQTFFSIGSGGNQAVSADLSLTYYIRAMLSSDSGVQYAIRNAIYRDDSVGYYLRSAIAANNDVGYILRSAIAQDDAEAYKIRGLIQSDDAEAYRVRGQVQATDNEYYSLRGMVQTDTTAAYDIQSSTSVASANAASYSVRSSVAADGSPQYAVLGSVQSSSSSAYAVRSSVYRDVAAVYAIDAAASVVYADLTTGYNVNGVASSGPSAESIAAAVLAALQATPIPVNNTLINGAPVIGDGSEANPWRGVGV